MLFRSDADNGKGLIEIWEPADAQGDIKCQLANSDTSATGGPVLTGAYQVAAKKLATGLEAILCDAFDCSGAVPFNNYTANVEYYKQRDFGRVALGMMSHYLFGHVDATAAITNDKTFVQSMLSVSAGGDDETADGAAARAAAFTKSTSANLEAWNYAATAADANLALRLVEAIVKKGKASNNITSTTLTQSSVAAITDTTTDSTLANIVKQVIGQDSSRTQNVDGSQRTRDQHLLLRFYAGDVIYVNIKVKRPTVEVTGYSAGANAPASTLVTEQSYVLKITLANPSEADPSKLTYSNGGLKVTGYTGTLAGSLTIPSGVTQIGDGAFANKTGLTKIILPASVTTIGDGAFSGAGLVGAVSLPGVTFIKPYAFQNCVGITSFSIPNLETLQFGAFRNTAISTMNLSMVKNLTGNEMFQNCKSLTSVQLPTSPISFSQINDYMFDGCSALTSITAPSSVTRIGDGAFANNTALTTVVAPSVSVIWHNAFVNCVNLTSVTFGTLTTVQPSAFGNTPKLNPKPSA